MIEALIEVMIEALHSSRYDNRSDITLSHLTNIVTFLTLVGL